MEVIRCKAEDSLFKKLKTELYGEENIPTVPEPSGPHLHQCFLVLDNGEPLARAALFNNYAQSGMKQRCAQVGCFEAKNNQPAANLLFEAISKEAEKLNAKALIGPMNGSTWHSYRFNENMDKPFFTEFVHPRYYPKLWEVAGFARLASFYSARSQNIRETKPKKFSIPEGLIIRNISLENYEQELWKIHKFCLKAFAGSFLFTPIPEEAFLELYQPLKRYIDPRLVMLAEVEGKLIGLVLGLPNLFEASGKSMVIKTLARLPDAEYRGLGSLLANMAYTRAQELQFNEIIHAFMLQEGQSSPVSSKLHGRPFRKYSLYKKQL